MKRLNILQGHPVFVSWRAKVFMLFAVLWIGYQRVDAQESPPIQWTTGPGSMDVGGVATLQLPDGFRFIGPDQIKPFNDLTQNVTDPTEVAVILPPAVQDGASSKWYIIVSYDQTVYVKDAKYTLAALIIGPTAAATFKLWKPLIAVGAGVLALFRQENQIRVYPWSTRDRWRGHFS